MKAIYIILSLSLLSACSWNTPKFLNPAEVNRLTIECENTGGNWIVAHSECENTNADYCTNNKWTFNECWSACRHEPEEKICTMQCVPVCKF